ncbi:MAG: XTP/dITP diphosphatase [Oscillospiraceae bacterium]
MKFIAATNNVGKLKELRRILEKMGHIVVSLKEAGIDIDVEETGATFEENARIKAKAVCKLTNKPTIADDSGLVVDALGGAPGVYSARYSGVHGDDEANNDKLLHEMRQVPKGERAAAFVSAVAVYMPNGSNLIVKGECKGYIGFTRKGTNGFGYDPLFNVDEYDGRSYAELTDEEKDTISHRGKALNLLKIGLPGIMGDEICAASLGVIQGHDAKLKGINYANK